MVYVQGSIYDVFNFSLQNSAVALVVTVV